MLAAIVMRPVTLTVLRIVVPASVVFVAAAAAGGHSSVVAIIAATACMFVVLSGELSAAYANGAAYPNERRYPLRAPSAMIVFIAPLAWALTIAGVVSGPLLLAAKRWIPGGFCAAAGLSLAAVLARSMHTLSRRWAGLVPAGLVLHDPLTLLDAVLFKRGSIDVLRPAPATSDSLDLTQRAPGLALELLLREKVPMVLLRGPRREPEAGSSARVLFTPVRPGALLRAAGERRIRVHVPGAPTGA
jgi:hypothetical protein